MLLISGVHSFYRFALVHSVPTLKASSRYAAIATATGNAASGAKYQQLASSLTKAAKAAGAGWLQPYGIHAASDAINAGVVSAAEAAEMLSTGVFCC
jgi:hypothetical protein